MTVLPAALGWILASVAFLVGAALLVMGLLGATGQLPGNSVFGLRIPEVRKSKENWQLAHKIAAPSWIGAGCAWVAAGALVLRGGGWLLLLAAALALVGLFLMGMGAGLAASTMARREQVAAEQAGDGCGGAGGGCCSTPPAPSPAACASGEACGSCGLNGACESAGHGGVPAPNVDLSAARRAAAEQDQQRA
ncbi:SdpI family protein [Corynebacterium heidelbergense]|uniref:SdpI family protein n=1 Tax=Corynebacterium heidelbergense TaxID=2055947 RepID=A0A364V4B7_9CORY|nr:SdpI family protein [Corynebacterium heidelbergense]RAV31456.1 hypothetical protein DLJ54_08260 [Corynebacterium heidelbergense]